MLTVGPGAGRSCAGDPDGCALPSEGTAPALSRGPLSQEITMRHPIDVVSAPGAPPAIGPYSQAIRAGDFVFVSGQVQLGAAAAGSHHLAADRHRVVLGSGRRSGRAGRLHRVATLAHGGDRALE